MLPDQNSLEIYFVQMCPQKSLQLIKFRLKMSRRFLRPLFSFWDPFFNEPFFPRLMIPRGSRSNRMYNGIEERKDDPYETFDNFFKDQFDDPSKLKKEQKEFFEKHYPEKVGKKFNPYEVLGVDEKADLEKIKEAYRTNAIKYHPKNDNTEEGKRKFNDLSRAYNELVNKKQTNDYGQDVSTKSLFEDFHNRMQNLSNTGAQNQNKIADQKDQKDDKVSKDQKDKTNMKPQEKKDQAQVKSTQQGKQEKKDFLKGAELYSQSSYFEYINGKKKLHVTKTYQKDGKTLRVDRVQNSRPDGTIEVTETLDDGSEVKHNKYIQGSNQKQKQIGY